VNAADLPHAQDGRSAFVVAFDWLAANLGAPGLKIVDASWYLPAQGRDAKAEFAARRIPGAVHFDIDAISDVTSGLPHTMPSAAQFAAQVGALGLSDSDVIVVHDGPGMFSAPRVWWMLRVFGARNAFVLDGGFDQWQAENRPVETTAPQTPPPAVFTPKVNALAVVDLGSMRKIVAGEDGGQGLQIADARGAGRFSAAEPEPRAGMRGGHMPGARNVHYTSLSEDGRLKPLIDLERVLQEAGIDLARPVVTTCGSGVTAAVITLALQSLGHRYNMLYDGSWSEWGALPDTPIVTGPAA
jgi:thiosulfate/3-mercaptopyruvate sulfurtransferase